MNKPVEKRMESLYYQILRESDHYSESLSLTIIGWACLIQKCLERRMAERMSLLERSKNEKV